jgi:hypothetical protein
MNVCTLQVKYVLKLHGLDTEYKQLKKPKCEIEVIPGASNNAPAIYINI